MILRLEVENHIRPQLVKRVNEPGDRKVVYHQVGQSKEILQMAFLLSHAHKCLAFIDTNFVHITQFS